MVPGFISGGGNKINPFFDLGIHKKKIYFGHVSDISEKDIDSVIFKADN